MSPTLVFVYILGILIVFCIGLFLVVVSRLFGESDNFTDRLQAYATITEELESEEDAKRRVRFLRWRLRINNALAKLVPPELRLQLLSAHWPIFETEYVLIRLSLTVLGFVFGWMLSGSILPGIGLTIIVYLMPGLILRRSINRRRLKFGRQLVDVLILVNGGVSAGYSLLQALDIVVEEMQPPASEEFLRVRREVGLGLPLSQALTNLAERMENDDLDIIVAAININMQTGGNLTVMLAAVTQTIRERIRLFSEVRSITAGQRYTGYVLTLLPFIVGGILFVMNPNYISKLFEPGWILCIPTGALLGIIMGNIVIQRMVKIEV
jgi:tight adherence protein B